MFKFLSRLFQSDRKSLSSYDKNIEFTTASAERLLEIINESIHILNDSNNIDTRTSRLGIAKEKMEELKDLVSKNVFLSITGLDQFEVCIKELELELNSHTNKTTKTTSKISEENKSAFEGYKPSATMQPKTPLAILKRHGECAKSIPASDQSLPPAHATWQLQMKPKYAFLGAGGTIGRPVGKIPADGGDVLPYLIKVREILEQPLSSPQEDMTEALNFLAQIKALAGGRIYEYDESSKLIENDDVIDYFPLIFTDDTHALDLILNEIGAPPHKGLTMNQLLELHAQGYSSTRSMLEAPDDVLLSLKGIGKKKLETIRENLSEIEC